LTESPAPVAAAGSLPQKVRRRLRRLRQLSAADCWRLGQALLALPINAAGVRLTGFRQWGAYLARAGGSRPPRAGSLPVARQTWRLVCWASRYGLYKGNCLSRSLTLWWLLRRQGLESDLRIGVSTSGGQFAAHAWIEYEGVVINDRPDVRERFGAFDLPAGSAIPFA
jgi:hypothetical protein